MINGADFRLKNADMSCLMDNNMLNFQDNIMYKRVCGFKPCKTIIDTEKKKTVPDCQLSIVLPPVY